MNGWKVRTTSRAFLLHIVISAARRGSHAIIRADSRQITIPRRKDRYQGIPGHRSPTIRSVIRFEARVIALSRSTGWKLLFWKGGGQPLPVNGLYELSCPFIGALFFFLPSLPFLSRFIYILLFLPFVFNRTPRRKGEREREGKRKNREGQEREAMKRSVYIRVYVYIFYRRQSRTAESTGPPPRSLRVRFN